VNDSNTIRLSAARSHRVSAARSFSSRSYSDTPEKITSYEAGHLLTLPASGLTLDSKLYLDAYRDIPVVTRVNNRPQQSTGNFTATGLDLQLRYEPSSDTLVALQYSYAHISDQVLIRPQPDPATDVYGKIMPQNTFTALLSKKLANDWQVSLTYSFVDEMEWQGWGDLVDSYQRLDARVARDFRVGGSRGKLELIGHNLTNSYTDFQDGNIMDRRLLVRIGLTY
jgi:outer membrane receptor protein involved in Fe transport